MWCDALDQGAADSLSGGDQESNSDNEDEEEASNQESPRKRQHTGHTVDTDADVFTASQRVPVGAYLDRSING
jgi:hypothetical protein